MKLEFKLAAAVLATSALATGSAAPFAAGAPGAMPPLWRSCKHVNARWPHGVGRLLAHDKTSGTPVTNFKRSPRLYRIAMSYNRGLDRDKDGIACEKH
jgi:hypothetical protein